MRKQNSPARWNLPSMEHAKANMLYAFSFNPESQPLNYKSDKLSHWWTEQVKTFSTMKGCQIQLSVEISKLGRLHFHGTLEINSLWKFYYYDVPFLMKEGAFEIDTIKKLEDWQTYIDKNKEEMTAMMQSFGLPRTIATKTIKIQKPDKTEIKRFFTEEPLTPNEDDTDSDSSSSSF